MTRPASMLFHFGEKARSEAVADVSFDGRKLEAKTLSYPCTRCISAKGSRGPRVSTK